VTTILAPATTATSTADQIINVLATYADEHQLDTGGGHQRTMLLAALIVRLFELPAHEAIDLARHDAYDERVTAAAQAMDEALDRARRARQAAEWTPQRGDAVIWTKDDHNHVWKITAFEDDQHVWLRHRDTPNTAASTFADHLISQGCHFGPLAAIADLRPFEDDAEAGR